MKKYLIRAIMLLLLTCLGVATAHAQGRLIRKLQERAEDKIIEEIFGDTDKSKETETIDAERDASSPTRHRRGGGLDQATPDVDQHILDAGAAFERQSYSGAKSSIRQALWGVELEIGRNILQSLPESVEGLDKLPENDRVSSTGVGFMGLMIERAYHGKDDMELRVSIGNDAVLFGIAGMYMMGGMYHTTDDTDHKQIRFKDHRATITYDDSEGYTLGVPFGQSSVFVLTGANFESESQFMAAANNFDIDRIKKELGEQ